MALTKTNYDLHFGLITTTDDVDYGCEDYKPKKTENKYLKSINFTTGLELSKRSPHTSYSSHPVPLHQNIMVRPSVAVRRRRHHHHRDDGGGGKKEI